LLTLQNSWYEDGHHFVRWRPVSQGLLRTAKLSLGKQLKSYLSLRCTHVKGRGGSKAAVWFAQVMARQYRYVARFDIRSYYESMNHVVLLKLLDDVGIDAESYALVSDYLSLPDTKFTGCGMVAGGSISPLLGAVYLTPLDRVMERLQPNHDIRYQRFMDDYLIFAPTRHKLKAALRCMYRVLEQLKLTVHPDKRYIGQIRINLFGLYFNRLAWNVVTVIEQTANRRRG
jgi:RNA-directed DNA polymerase